MQLPSVNDILNSIQKTVIRFPLAVLAFFGTSVVAIILNHNFNSDLMPLLLTLLTSVPLAIGVDLFVESQKGKVIFKTLARILLIALMVTAYFFFFNSYDSWSDRESMQTFLIILTSIIFAFFAPFISKGRENGFWQFVVAVIFAFVETFLYFAVLYLGIVALMISINYLFDVEIKELYFFDVWVSLVGYIASIFFLNRVPANFQALDKTTNYSKILNVLVDYVLLPLVCLYMVLIYAYIAKIIFMWEWPMGGVASWVTGFLSVGVVAYFFSNVAWFKKWFYVAAIPLIAVLFLAVGMRINDYGFTEPRYFVALFGVWMSVMAIYYLVSRAKSLKFILMSAFVLILISAFGPQSAFDVSRWSQINRLEQILDEEGILVDGKIVPVAEGKSMEISRVSDIDSILYYLDRSDSLDEIEPWFDKQILDSHDASLAMGLTQVSTYDDVNIGAQYVTYLLKEEYDCMDNIYACARDVKGYKYFYNFDYYTLDYFPFIFNAGDQKYSLQHDDGVLTLKNDSGGLLSVNVANFVESLDGEDSGVGQFIVPGEQMVIVENDVEFVITRITVKLENGEFSALDSIGGYFLIDDLQ
ncbi:MAG: DUF4153 domain-containing protein [Patescibacteria group bacterium]